MDERESARMTPAAPFRLDVPPRGSSGSTTQRPFRIRIPTFPAFKLLELSDQFEVEQWVKRFQPYSDFNFVSLWSWNTTNGFELSWLHDNLVILFNDYGSGEQFLSFIGTNEPDATADVLLEFARRRGIVRELRLLPEETARALSPRPGLLLMPAPEHDDYVLSTESWSTLAGGRFRNKRNEISRFVRVHAAECRQIDLGDVAMQRAIMQVFGRWIVKKEVAGRFDTSTEAVAVRRIFSLHRPGDLLAFGLFVDDALVGYSINERLGDGFAMGHHWKADAAYSGAYPLLLRDTCRTLAREGIAFMNIQQDLGEPGLATAKRLYRPAWRLRKYRLSIDEPARESWVPNLAGVRPISASASFDRELMRTGNPG